MRKRMILALTGLLGITVRQTVSPEGDRSYRALLRLPSVGRILLGMQIARIGQSMVAVALVLFTLTSYRSATVAGVVTFFNIFPGLLVSSIAGALLDRHGRMRLVALDYIVALTALALIGGLALAGALPRWLLMVIAGVASLTNPLSATGLRSLFPLIVPAHLWERVNAIDSTGFIIAAILGPPLAAGLVALWGGPIALLVIGATFGLAAFVIWGSADPAAPGGPADPGASVLADAWSGLVYTWRNRTLRGLAFSISSVNVASGILNIVMPVIILERLHLGETVVGVVFAVQGLAGIISAIAFGRMDSRERERAMLALSMAATGVSVALIILRSDLAMLLVIMSLYGALQGPMDIALFTLRQRRTEPAWMGRAFAVSYSFNYLGFPIGSALAGVLAGRSIETAILVAVVTCFAAAIFAMFLVPSNASM